MKKRITAIGLCCFAAALSAVADEFTGYRKVDREEAREIKAFDNPDFEDVSKYGTVGRHVEYGRFGFNGNGGVRLRPYERKLSHRFPLKARLEKGRRYIFSADVRTHGKTFVQIACDCYHLKPRRYASGHGAWGPSAKDIGDGWRHMELDFVAKADSDTLDYVFMAHCFVQNDGDAASPDNWIDVDNIAIREDVPKWYFCNTWPTHNRIHKEEGRVRCHTWFFGAYLEKGAEPVYALRLGKPDGTPLAQKTVRADAKGVMTADFGPLAYTGPVKLAATLYDRARRLEFATKTLDLSVEPRPAKGFTCTENGIVLRDGRPYMPLGFYSGLAHPRDYTEAEVEKHLKMMQEAGFNVMMDYSTYLLPTGSKRMDWYYGLCRKYGIDVLNDDFKVADDYEKMVRNLPRYRARAEHVVKYPSIIGFYIMDEGSESHVKPLTVLRRMLNEVAPDKIVNVCNIMRPAPYLPIADIQGGDCYPINGGKSSMLMPAHTRVKAMKDCAPAAIWWAPQAYNWASSVRGALKDPQLYRTAERGREATADEMLAVALCNAADGVTGFFFYSHFDIFRCPVKEWIPKRWENMCEVGRVIKGLEPFIMSGRTIVDVPHVDKADPVRVAAMTDGKGAWRVIVCGLGRNHETSFTLPAAYGRLKPTRGAVTREGDRYVYRGKEFTCDLLR